MTRVHGLGAGRNSGYSGEGKVHSFFKVPYPVCHELDHRGRYIDRKIPQGKKKGGTGRGLPEAIGVIRAELVVSTYTATVETA